MHHIYTTKSFVIHSMPHGEAGKFLIIFTKEFGMIGATAEGVRLAKSKLRYHLQDFSYSNISVVKGKEVWRITGAHEIDSKKNDETRVKILRLLRRLVSGEEKNEPLFEIIEKFYEFEPREAEMELLECLTMIRILYNLGYISYTEETKNFFYSNEVNSETLENVKRNKAVIIKMINRALVESQL